MKSQTKYGLLVGAGFLVGSVGLKALTSQAARRVYVQGIAKGLQAKSCYEGIVEQAPAILLPKLAMPTSLHLAYRTLRLIRQTKKR